MAKTESLNDRNNNQPIIIIGTGSAGVRLVHQLLYLDPTVSIKIFGGEDQQPYSRENLLKMLAGKYNDDQLHAATQLPDVKNVEILLNNPITTINLRIQIFWIVRVIYIHINTLC